MEQFYPILQGRYELKIDSMATENKSLMGCGVMEREASRVTPPPGLWCGNWVGDSASHKMGYRDTETPQLTSLCDLGQGTDSSGNSDSKTTGRSRSV